MDSYRTLVAWQKAHEFVSVILRLIDEHWHIRYRNLFDQLGRAALSIESNIVEGYALDTKPYFKKHCRIAFGSAAEAEIVLGDVRDRKALPVEEIDAIVPVLHHCQRALRGLIGPRKP